LPSSPCWRLILNPIVDHQELWVEQFPPTELQQNGKKENGGHLDKNFMLRVSIFENKK